ncbi:OLC1v1016308C1 [Oldenlandia corymbosa var. corymbosa]|uniref:OLC1v1016308C1 n=1 Tax=Oldenlandia corymbosa var. corymbosa TaxID=529605 RepID=A0AAV1E7E9_OLDCO|nr:OLC1v1016308C1 [Oldenlandia corymbosa var. corymbosa]
MGHRSQTPPPTPSSPEFHGARHRLGGVCRRCKSFVSRCYPERSPSPRKMEGKHKPNSIDQEHKAHDHHNNFSQVTMNGKQELRYSNGDQVSPRGMPKHQSYDKAYFTQSPLSSPPTSRNPSPLPNSRSISPSPLSRSSSKRSQTPIRSAAASLLKSMSRRKSVEATTPTSSLSRNASRRSSTTIIYSNSHKLILKPPPMIKTLECTLEELCFGCIKKMKITRAAVTEDGQIIEEDEVLTIKVKPGWRKGTKITFEGMGNEAPGADAADVVFTIVEKQHRLYKRRGDDLELVVEIPLVNALTGSTLPIPLLGGEKMILTIDDIVYPGFQKIIAGQGMPKQHEEKRGNLIITLLVKFPTELTEEQKSDIVMILQDSC